MEVSENDMTIGIAYKNVYKYFLINQNTNVNKLFVTCLMADWVILKSTLWKKAENHSVRRPRGPARTLSASLPPHPHHRAGLRGASASFLLYFLGLESGQSKSESGINLLLFIITLIHLGAFHLLEHSDNFKEKNLFVQLLIRINSTAWK